MDKNVREIFNRWFNNDKSFKATELKKVYPDHYDEVKDDKFGKPFVNKVMEPLDNLFLAIGNELIDLLDGFTNKDSHNKVITTLRNDMEETIELVKQSGSTEADVLSLLHSSYGRSYVPLYSSAKNGRVRRAN